MKYLLRAPVYFCLSLLITFTACKNTAETVNAPAPDMVEFTNLINEEGLRADLTYLSSDELQGRDTGSEGLKQAAQFLSDRYEAMGVQPGGDNGSYFQSVDLSYSTFESITYQLTDADGNVINESTLSKDATGSFSTLLGGESVAEGALVFAGMGIRDEATGVDHFPADATGKWLLLFYERGISDFRVIQSMMGADGARGAILIMGTDTASFREQARELSTEFGEVSDLELAYLQDDQEESFSPAVNRIDPMLAARILEADGLEDLAAMMEELKNDSTGSFSPYEIAYSLRHTPEVVNGTVVSDNVIAYIPGSDPVLKDELVVLSAHYDHVGVGSPNAEGDRIYNGADDDGSGTVGLLHTAQAIMAAKKAGAGPKRGVMLLHVTGEEKGLLGSRYYSDHPTYPIEQTVANLNVDMIGRRDYEHPEDPNYVYVIGGSIISSGLDSLMQVANARTVNISLSDRYNDLNDPNQFYRRSDHWNFGRLGVPFIFFFNGVHDDYHQPSDEVDKIDFEALSKRTQLIYATTMLVANADARPLVDNEEFIERTRR